MKNTFTAIVFAAAVAALFTLLTAPVTEVTASPLPTKAQAGPVTVTECAPLAWPYLRCNGSRLGNPNARLVTADRIAS